MSDDDAKIRASRDAFAWREEERREARLVMWVFIGVTLAIIASFMAVLRWAT